MIIIRIIRATIEAIYSPEKLKRRDFRFRRLLKVSSRLHSRSILIIVPKNKNRHSFL